MIKRKLVTTSLVVITALCVPAAVHAVDVECHPTVVGEDYNDRFSVNGAEVGAVAVQCEERSGVVYYVARNDGQAAARFTSLALAALLSGKRLRLSYNESTSTCKQGLQCFLLYQWSIWR